MSLLVFLPILTTLLFGVIAVFLAIKEDSLKKRLFDEEKKEKLRSFQIGVLRELQEEGNGFSIEKVIEIITANLKNFLPYSTASTLLLDSHGIRFAMQKEQAVSTSFAEEVKKSMLDSLGALLNGDLPPLVSQSYYGKEFDNMSIKRPASFFHIPLIVNDRVVGILNLTSSTPNQYQEDEVTLLYQLVNQASHPIAHLEEVLAREKGKVLAMIASLSDGVVMVDTNREVVLVNNAARDILHVTKPKLSFIDLVSILPNTINFTQKITETLEKKISCEVPNLTIGEKKCKVTITPVVYRLQSQDRLIGACLTVTDLTIEHSVSQMKEDFTNVIVHELRSPLTSIKAGTDLLIKQKDTLPPEEQQKLLELINSQSIKLLDEVSLILDAAKLESGLFTLQKSEVQIGEIIAEKTELFASQAKNKYITVTVDVDPTIPSFSADKRALGLVINNLLSNSLKFTPVGGKITVTAKKLDHTLHLSVADTGVGIDKAVQDKLFKKFSQIVTPNANVGTGLGLYIVKGVIEAHGGSVSLVSDHTHGTTISFTLPLIQSHKTEIPAVTAHQPVPVHPLTAN